MQSERRRTGRRAASVAPRLTDRAALAPRMSGIQGVFCACAAVAYFLGSA
jgi:hypothetical protein